MSRTRHGRGLSRVHVKDEIVGICQLGDGPPPLGVEALREPFEERKYHDCQVVASFVANLKDLKVRNWHRKPRWWF